MGKILKTAAVLLGMQSALVMADVHVSGVWMPEPIPGRTVTAVFMNLHNMSATDTALVSASATWAGSVEIHTHEHDNGVMRMRQVDKLTIAGNKAQELKQGGLHLMVFDVKQPLPQNPELELCYDNGSCQTVQVTVRTKDDQPSKEKGHQHGHSHH